MKRIFKYLFVLLVLFFCIPSKAEATITQGFIPSPINLQPGQDIEVPIDVFFHPSNYTAFINDDYFIPTFMRVGGILQMTNMATGQVFTYDSQCSSNKMPPLNFENFLPVDAYNEGHFQVVRFKFINNCQTTQTIDQMFIYDYDDISPFLTTMITVPSSSDTSLNVPYYSQNTSPWGQSEYDHTQSLGFLNTTMDRWGCAVTSVAMVLRYHNINQFLDGTPIDPGSLNNWLKANNGYVTGYGSGGSYSYLNWPVIGKLTKQLFDAGKSTVKLEHKRAYPSPATIDLLNNDLTVGNDVGKFPDILWVQNAQTSGHFVVAKGLLNNTYAINDPEWNYPDLSYFNNSYMQVDRYVPSHTNLSYLLLVINPNTELLVSDSQGRKTGKWVHDGVTNVFNEIPGATYSFENPIVNPDGFGNSEFLGTGVNSFLLPEPTDGDYQVTVSGNTDTNYTLNAITFQDSGENTINKSEGTVVSNGDNTVTVAYSQTQPSNVSKVITFDSTIQDINELFILNQITQKSIANSLVRNIEQAQKASLAGDITKIQQNLDQATTLLDRNRGGKITERAYQILSSDVVALKNQN